MANRLVQSQRLEEPKEGILPTLLEGSQMHVVGHSEKQNVGLGGPLE